MQANFISKYLSFMKNLGLKIRVARTAKRLSQEQLAEKINKTRPLVSHIEQTGKVNIHTLKKICQVLDLSIEDLENEGNESINLPKNNSIQALKAEIDRLTDEIAMLKELVATQKEFIAELKAKQAKKR